MKVHFILAYSAATVVGGCATPHQYVYNCTPFTINFDRQQIAPRTFKGSSGPRHDPAGAKATYPDGSVHAPLRVKSNHIDSFALSNAWISPANVCRQFSSQVVIVDLR